MKRAARKMSVLWTAAAPRLNRSCGGAPSSSSMQMPMHHHHLRVGDVLSRDIPDTVRPEHGGNQFPEEKKRGGLRTLHQSINGLPRCGVAMVVSDNGVYSSGLRCVIRWRQSSPPIECAMKLIPRPEALACRNLSRRSAREAIEPVPGTAVTITSAPTILRRIPRIVDQYCIRRLGGPRTSKPYNPAIGLFKKKIVATWVGGGGCVRTVAEHDGEPRCAERIIQHWTMHQPVYRTAVLVLLLCGSWGWRMAVWIRTRDRSVRSWRLGELLRGPGRWIEER